MEVEQVSPPPQPVLDVPTPTPLPVLDVPPPQQPVLDVPSPLESVLDVPPPPPQIVPDNLTSPPTLLDDNVTPESAIIDIIVTQEKDLEPGKVITPEISTGKDESVEVIKEDTKVSEEKPTSDGTEDVINITPEIENRSLETVLVELSKEMKEVVEDAVIELSKEMKEVVE